MKKFFNIYESLKFDRIFSILFFEIRIEPIFEEKWCWFKMIFISIINFFRFKSSLHHHWLIFKWIFWDLYMSNSNFYESYDIHPYPWFFGTITERVFCKKIQNHCWWRHSWDSGKLHVQIDCQLGFDVMLISNGICQYEGKDAVLNKNICHFSGPSPSVFCGKKSKARKHIQVLLDLYS